MANDREITLVIKADGKIAVKEVDSVKQAIKGLADENAKVAPKIDGAAKAIKGVGEEAGKGIPKIDGYSQYVKTLGERSGSVAPKVSDVSKAVKTLGDESKASTGSVDVLNKSWDRFLTGVNQGLEVFSKLSGALKTSWDFAKGGAEFAEAQKYFENFANSAGKSSQAFLSALKRSSDGLVSERELMAKTTRAMRLGVAEDFGTLGKLWEIATVKSDLMGISVSQAFDKMTDAISEGSSRSLIEMGLIPEEMDRVTEKSELLEKRVTLTMEVLKQGAEDMKRFSEVGNTTADKMERLSVAFQDTKDAAAANLSEGLIPWVEYLTREGIPAIRDTVEWMNKLFFGIDRTEEYIKGTLEKSELGTIDTKIGLIKERLGTANRLNLDSDVTGMWEGQLKELQAQRQALSERLRSERDTRLTAASKSRDEQQKRAESDLQSWITTNYDPMITAGELEKTDKKAKSLSKSISECRTATEGFVKALEEAFESGQNRSFNAMPASFDKIAEKAKQTANAFLTIGQDKVWGKSTVVLNVFKQVTTLSGKIVGDLEAAATSLERIEKLKSIGFGIVGAAGGISVPGGINLEKKRVIDDDEKKYKQVQERLRQKQEDLVREFGEKLQINVADAFEAGLYDGLNGGNFLESFGKGLRSQVARALSASITNQIFGTGGGTFNVAGMLMGGSSDYAAGLPAAANTVAYNADGSGGNVLKGGLVSRVFKPMWGDSGNFLWKNAASNVGIGLAAGYALDRLTGAGGLFGGRIDHGSEVIGQAGDINAQVTEAMKQRDEYLKTAVGLSKDTYKQLQTMTFYTAGYSWDDSGDGVFSKKTRTYSLDAGAAQAALKQYTDLTKKATEEMALRTLEISFKGLNSPLEALQMSLADLKAAIENAPDELSRKSLQLQATQTQRQIDAASMARAGEWGSFIVQNPFAGYGADAAMPVLGGKVDPLTYGKTVAGRKDFQNTGYITIDDPRGGYYTFDGFDDSIKLPKQISLTMEEYRNWTDQQVMMQGLKNQSSLSYQIAKAQAQGKDMTQERFLVEPFKMTFNNGHAEQTGGELKTYKELLEGNVTFYQKIMEDLEKQLADATLKTEQRNQLFQSWQEAQAAYYASKSDALNFEIAEEAKLKAKRTTARDDILGTLMTRVGELQEKNGQQVIVLTPGQQGGKELIEKLKGALSGTEPEVVKLLEDFSESYLKANWQ